ncbi:hypothetical protein BJ085DRAFT_41514 [Dimargaris cristalligena]|uniref:Uncharacterized protein n=1 Tax=Dimargaris cristalligena TaxID=215637 RepID=A0A4Q0A2T2_9FUNG|nr:hypothetical protein BJ085DRAFT_41514 [Dimargaris cristalligena]|eukprot:RKP40148.1 hypothetical protein BJ085DRAFT_41514 [Dimargaris cristalligena]
MPPFSFKRLSGRTAAGRQPTTRPFSTLFRDPPAPGNSLRIRSELPPPENCNNNGLDNSDLAPRFLTTSIGSIPAPTPSESDFDFALDCDPGDAASETPSVTQPSEDSLVINIDPLLETAGPDCPSPAPTPGYPPVDISPPDQSDCNYPNIGDRNTPQPTPHPFLRMNTPGFDHQAMVVQLLRDWKNRDTEKDHLINSLHTQLNENHEKLQKATCQKERHEIAIKKVDNILQATFERCSENEKRPLLLLAHLEEYAREGRELAAKIAELQDQIDRLNQEELRLDLKDCQARELQFAQLQEDYNSLTQVLAGKNEEVVAARIDRFDSLQTKVMAGLDSQLEKFTETLQAILDQHLSNPSVELPSLQELGGGLGTLDRLHSRNIPVGGISRRLLHDAAGNSLPTFAVYHQHWTSRHDCHNEFPDQLNHTSPESVSTSPPDDPPARDKRGKAAGLSTLDRGTATTAKKPRDAADSHSSEAPKAAKRPRTYKVLPLALFLPDPY